MGTFVSFDMFLKPKIHLCDILLLIDWMVILEKRLLQACTLSHIHHDDNRIQQIVSSRYIHTHAYMHAQSTILPCCLEKYYERDVHFL